VVWWTLIRTLTSIAHPAPIDQTYAPIPMGRAAIGPYPQFTRDFVRKNNDYQKNSAIFAGRMNRLHLGRLSPTLSGGRRTDDGQLSSLKEEGNQTANR
jgi:hypothetical protein